MNTGKNNSLTDVEGLLVGHFTDTKAACGVSVAICPEEATAGVDVRGSAPGTRETDLLAPINLVEKPHDDCQGLCSASSFPIYLMSNALAKPCPKLWDVPH